MEKNVGTFLCEKQERGNDGPGKIGNLDLQGDQGREGRIATCGGIGTGQGYEQGLFITAIFKITF